MIHTIAWLSFMGSPVCNVEVINILEIIPTADLSLKSSRSVEYQRRDAISIVAPVLLGIVGSLHLILAHFAVPVAQSWIQIVQ